MPSSELDQAANEADTLESRHLISQELQGLAELPPAVEWLAIFRFMRPHAEYGREARDGARFLGTYEPVEHVSATGAHVIARREERKGHGYSASSIRTTRLHDKRRLQPKDRPSSKMMY